MATHEPITDPLEVGRLVAAAVRKRHPDAAVCLFGSRARGDATSDSDWDFKVITDYPVDGEDYCLLLDDVYAATQEVEGPIELTVSSRKSWEKPLSRVSPFYRNLQREGIWL